MERNSDLSDLWGMQTVQSVVPSESCDNALQMALLRARDRVIGPLRSMLAHSGLTEQQWRVLRVLEEDTVLDATEIAERACLMLPSLTRILNTLESKELIRREPDPRDRRKQRISISRAGHDTIDAHLIEVQRLHKHLADQMGPHRLSTLVQLLLELDAVPAMEQANPE
ncbi:DNA-binding transcriptional repressor MarR [Thalassovita mediterranea]|jgi:homoprotocatechuate degradation regulator HpaR|uniref:DNA-binding transcriptional repressor MarR n=2 Tax=Thalassovita mediterranea TaxID=340021 RepID=A0A0N7M1Y7_9RHOB|nr:DNA-binding transcriptional repressor MarR [Thalassovita mediterranea]SIS32274.1 transcriptional regulator, MarR family [Thalassovita mediterranea]